MLLTVKKIEKEVEKIREIKWNCEGAHIREDALHQLVLKEIASNKYNVEEVLAFAKTALETKKIDFARWCA